MERLRQGLVLVIVGIVLYFLVREQGSGSGGVILALIGSAFMVFYALTNQSGYLVPGGLMTGLGIGIDWPHAWWPGFQGSTVLIGLGLGLLVVWVGSRRGEGHWALASGVVLLLVGALTGVGDIMAFLSLWWPVVVAAIGLWVILAGSRKAS
ncbi:MAG: hypothetical protein GX961_02080 [Firmicutes bacterium]|uniref:hypothetical protein n=1 Tax=Limnochorda pilosa TaxID=1555112 RepID=UPI0017A9DD62|nr:hypothetical protein [Limnochorda pilosa]NMA70692.1 hypothetical protein [Bacillota bacterium]